METIQELHKYRVIPGYSEYGVTIDGDVIRFRNGRYPNKPVKKSIQITTKGDSGYYYVTLLSADKQINGELTCSINYRRIAVHRLVAFAWLNPPTSEDKVWINHKDGNKLNNNATNLEWSTISENIQHAFDTGLKVAPKGEHHWLYGKKQSASTRHKQSLSKQGEKHPKFGGYWVVLGKRFASTTLAAKYLSNIRLDGKKWYPKKVYTWCKKKREGFYFEERKKHAF